MLMFVCLFVRPSVRPFVLFKLVYSMQSSCNLHAVPQQSISSQFALLAFFIKQSEPKILRLV